LYPWLQARPCDLFEPLLRRSTRLPLPVTLHLMPPCVYYAPWQAPKQAPITGPYPLRRMPQGWAMAACGRLALPALRATSHGEEHPDLPAVGSDGLCQSRGGRAQLSPTDWPWSGFCTMAGSKTGFKNAPTGPTGQSLPHLPCGSLPDGLRPSRGGRAQASPTGWPPSRFSTRLGSKQVIKLVPSPGVGRPLLPSGWHYS